MQRSHCHTLCRYVSCSPVAIQQTSGLCVVIVLGGAGVRPAGSATAVQLVSRP